MYAAAMPYPLFCHLCETLEIRDGSLADRDRQLYLSLRHHLGMGDAKPAEFFAAQKGLSRSDVLVAFMNALAPFTLMIERIFQVCSGSRQAATGGNDFTIDYDSGARALRFDLTTFLEFRNAKRRTLYKGILPRYHSDFVPSVSRYLQILAGSPRVRLPDTGLERTLSPLDVSTLLRRARDVLLSHRTALSKVDVRHDISSQLEAAGFEGAHLPTEAVRFEAWRGTVEDSLSLLDNLDATDIQQRLDPRELAAATRNLSHCLDALSQEVPMEIWERFLEQYLRLPYWKKRWQVYQIWVAVEVLERFLAVGARIQQRQLQLHTGVSCEPLAVQPVGSAMLLELWSEFTISGSSHDFRPDISFVVKQANDERLPLTFIECKQHSRAKAADMHEAAKKYLPIMPLGSTHLLVNYDPFRDPGLVERKRVVDGRTLEVQDEVYPGGNGGRAIDDFLARFLGRPPRHPWILVLDTTHSMGDTLSRISAALIQLSEAGIAPVVRAVLFYGDHGAAYVTLLHADKKTLVEASAAILDVERTDGNDLPEALEDALYELGHASARLIDTPADILIFTDAPPHQPSECPKRFDATAETDHLLTNGCRVVLVDCRPGVKRDVLLKHPRVEHVALDHFVELIRKRWAL